MTRKVFLLVFIFFCCGNQENLNNSSADLQSLIDNTKFSISSEETRYYLNGIYLHQNNEKKDVFKAVATDGHRLAQVEMILPEGADGMPSIIIPRKTVGELRKLNKLFCLLTVIRLL